MKTLHIDIESFSACDITKAGSYRYAEDPSTEITLIAWAFDNGPVQIEDLQGDAPRVFGKAWLTDPGILKMAHNAEFETYMFEKVWGVPIDLGQWQCTAVMASYCGLPRSLGAAGKVIGLPQDQQKMTAGKRLIRKFCIPRKPTKKDPSTRASPSDHPDDWQLFKDYCVQDVVSEREIHHKLRHFAPPKAEWAAWRLDQKINRTGLPIDRGMVSNAIDLNGVETDRLMARAREITSLANPNSRAQLLAWLTAEGEEMETLRKHDVAEKLGCPDLSPEVSEVLEIRQRLAKSSIKKYAALRAAVSADGRLRGAFQFYGASRTGRWAGRLFQPQNLPRHDIGVDHLQDAREAILANDAEWAEMIHGPLPTVLSSLVRTAIAPPPGLDLHSADFSSIETVMLAWAAGCTYLLDLIRNGLDPYKDFAARFYGVPYEEVTKKQRTFAKPPVLGAGYRLGGAGLVAYAEGMGVHMDETTAKEAVTLYRTSYPEIPRFWYALERAAFDTVETGKSNNVGPFTFRKRAPFLEIDLPSGRSLRYLRPRIEEVVAPWGDKTTNLTYEGQHQISKAWTRLSTQGGKLAENIVQAISRDLLVTGLINADAAGFEIVGHVHDEIIDVGVRPVSELIDVMVRLPDWCADAPVKAAGYANNFYIKD